MQYWSPSVKYEPFLGGRKGFRLHQDGHQDSPVSLDTLRAWALYFGDIYQDPSNSISYTVLRILE